MRELNYNYDHAYCIFERIPDLDYEQYAKVAYMGKAHVHDNE